MSEHPCAEFIEAARTAQDNADNLAIQLQALQHACADVLSAEKLDEVQQRWVELLQANYPQQ